MEARSVGLLVVGLGLLLVLMGLVILAGGLGWFGRLPGDARIEQENVKIYVPIASMLLLSLVLSLLLALFRRWF